jgi:hypothetical protein
MTGGIGCTCGHTIVEDGTCCCPNYCLTCAGEDCCAEVWASRDHAAPGTCHVCGYRGRYGVFNFVGTLADGTPKCQCANALGCAQRQLDGQP